MEILNRLITKFKEAFLSFNEEAERKYRGNRFEEWVVKQSNISKNCFAEPNSGNFWRFLEWRGDKYVDGYSPLSSSSPDLLLECICSKSLQYKLGDMITVECKWRKKKDFFLDKDCVIKYEKYMTSNQSRLPIKDLFYVFGFGWSCGNPESVYVIPAKKLYDCNVKDKNVIFQLSNSKDKSQHLDCYKNQSKRLMYRQ